MYEHKREKLASTGVFYKRFFKNFLFAFLILLICLLIGVVGYHFTANIPWLDALHNASMILGGMGPVVSIETVPGKWFSSFYAIFSGVIFITNVGIILAPGVHRLYHSLHLEE